MKFLTTCFLLLVGASLVSVEGKAVDKRLLGPVMPCLIPITCFVNPCSVVSCDGACVSDCYCNAQCTV